MKKFKFTIAGQPYDTTVNEIEPNVCEVTVNGTVFQVEIEKQETLKKKPVVAPRPAATGAAAPAAKPAAAPAAAGPLVPKVPAMDDNASVRSDFATEYPARIPAIP